MDKSKAETFIGFAMRTGNFRIGANAAATLKRANLMIVCSSASENTKKEAEKLAKKFKCPLIEPTVKTLEEITHRENAKVMAIADKNLSAAILDNLEKEFIARI
jgi:ribosomal protein L30E